MAGRPSWSAVNKVVDGWPLLTALTTVNNRRYYKRRPMRKQPTVVCLYVENTRRRQWTWSSAFIINRRLSPVDHTRHPALCIYSAIADWAWGSVARSIGVSWYYWHTSSTVACCRRRWTNWGTRVGDYRHHYHVEIDRFHLVPRITKK